MRNIYFKLTVFRSALVPSSDGPPPAPPDTVVLSWPLRSVTSSVTVTETVAMPGILARGRVETWLCLVRRNKDCELRSKECCFWWSAASGCALGCFTSMIIFLKLGTKSSNYGMNNWWYYKTNLFPLHFKLNFMFQVIFIVM